MKGLVKFRAKRDRLPREQHSALWEVPECYDLCVYSRGARHWVVSDGILATRRDQKIAALLQGQRWATRREALAAARQAGLLIDQSSL